MYCTFKIYKINRHLCCFISVRKNKFGRPWTELLNELIFCHVLVIFETEENENNSAVFATAILTIKKTLRNARGEKLSIATLDMRLKPAAS